MKKKYKFVIVHGPEYVRPTVTGSLTYSGTNLIRVGDPIQKGTFTLTIDMDNATGNLVGTTSNTEKNEYKFIGTNIKYK